MTVDMLGRSSQKINFTSKWRQFASALLTAYVCERLHISLPGNITMLDILPHLDDMKPYVGVVHFHHFLPQVYFSLHRCIFSMIPLQITQQAPFVLACVFFIFFEQLEAINHIIYTINDFGFYSVDPKLMPDEFSMLQNAMVVAIEHLQNPEVCVCPNKSKQITTATKHPTKPFLFSKLTGCWRDPGCGEAIRCARRRCSDQKVH